MKKLINGDCLVELKSLEDCSVDAIVSDPPYELGFMGKKWDASGIAYNVELWSECLRVLKPGGHLLAFGGTRTYHRMACAIEDAGFEVRDMLEWIYASGFPKSLNVAKAYDKMMGNEREIIEEKFRGNNAGKKSGIMGETVPRTDIITKGNSAWEGFGTAIKPAHEPIVMARKPLSEKTIVENVLKHGTGAIDIDGCRIPTSDNPKGSGNADKSGGEQKWGFVGNGGNETSSLGRFPANIICTDDALNDGVMTKSTNNVRKNKVPTGEKGIYNKYEAQDSFGHNDSGSKSRYFDIDVWGEKYGLLQYPKASKRERNEGCEGLEEKIRDTEQMNSAKCLQPDGKLHEKQKLPRQNNHPTVKPTHLMAWLVRLVSKEGDTVLDPFMGSGTTGVSATKLNRNFIGIELDKDYFEIAQKRIQSV